MESRIVEIVDRVMDILGLSTLVLMFWLAFAVMLDPIIGYPYELIVGFPLGGAAAYFMYKLMTRQSVN